MKANYRRFKDSSKGYSRNSSKSDLHRALWEEELEATDDSSLSDTVGIPNSHADEVDRVVLTRGAVRSGQDNRFAALRSLQEERTTSEWQRVEDEKPASFVSWLAGLWSRLLGR